LIGGLGYYGTHKQFRRDHPPIIIAQASSPHHYETIAGETIDTYDISATNPDWQPTVTLTNGEIATITTFQVGMTNGSWITDSRKGDTPLGAGGYSNSPASGDFELAGAPEGSLLMRLRDGTHGFWTNSSQTQIVTIPGTISFMPNDDIANGAAAFRDNRGSIRVKIKVSKSPTIISSIHDYFKKDFQEQTSIGYVEKMVSSKTRLPSYDVEVRLCFDFSSKSQILLFYLSRDNGAFSACKNLAASTRAIINKINNTGTIDEKIPTDYESMSSTNLIFTGLVYIYTEQDFSLEEMGLLESIYKTNNLQAVFRGNSYATIQWLETR
jgi:hypothetical protein